jgi:hypothetical protein
LAIPAAVKWLKGLPEEQAMKQLVLAQAPVLELLQKQLKSWLNSVSMYQGNLQTNSI